MKTATVDMFFDTDRVKRAVDTATRKNLSKAGAFVRTAARSSIRKRKKVSAPGKPPSSHTGLLKKFIFFAYEPARQSVFVGPVQLSRKVGAAPEALEHGGPSIIVSGRRNKRKKRRIMIPARPYMAPALAKEAPKFKGLWANSVR